MVFIIYTTKAEIVSRGSATTKISGETHGSANYTIQTDSVLVSRWSFFRISHHTIVIIKPFVIVIKQSNILDHKTIIINSLYWLVVWNIFYFSIYWEY